MRYDFRTLALGSHDFRWELEVKDKDIRIVDRKTRFWLYEQLFLASLFDLLYLFTIDISWSFLVGMVSESVDLLVAAERPCRVHTTD